MMLRPTATKVVPTSDYQLIVTFDIFRRKASL